MSKICVYCSKDVSNQPRVKDPAGKYYCEPCYAQHGGKVLEHGQTAAAPKPASKPAAASDELMLKEEEPRRVVKAVAPRVAAVTASSAAASDDLMLKDDEPPKPARARPNPAENNPASAGQASVDMSKVPDVCPACGLKVVVKSQFCLKCKRDLTKMDTFLKYAKEEDKKGMSWFFGKIMGRTLGLIMGLVLMVIIMLALFRAFAQPGDAFEDYPTSREKLVREFMTQVAGSEEKTYEKAYNLISTRETGVSHTMKESTIENIRHFRDHLVKKHGTDWLSKMKIVIPPPDKYLGDEVFVQVKIDSATYHIGVQAQIGLKVAEAERMKPRKAKVPIMEDGKMHWGIGECKESMLAFPTEAVKYRPGSQEDGEDASLPIPVF